jgi:hypothetical protein
MVESLRAHRAELGVVGGFAAVPEIEAEALVEDERVAVRTASGRTRAASQHRSRPRGLC